MSIYDETSLNLSGVGAAEQLRAETVSPGFIEMLGAKPLAGRFFVDGDDSPGITPPVVISERLWRQRFGGSRSIVGTTLTLDGQQAVVVGVAERGFHGLSFEADIWATLLPFSPGSADDRGSRWLAALSRLAPGVSRDVAQRELEAVTTAMEVELPQTNAERRADVITLHEYFLDSSRVLLLALLAAVGVLLMIVCVNVLSLQLVRGLARDQEVAIRYSLGARRSRVVRQLVTESLVLAGVGGMAGILMAWSGTRSIVALVPAGVIPPYAGIALDLRVLSVSVVLIALAGVLSGLLPAIRSSHSSLAGSLRSGDRGGAQGSNHHGYSLQHVLVATEIGLAVALMLGGAVMIRSLRAQLAVDPGFDPSNVVAARLFLSAEQYEDPQSRVLFADRVLEAMRRRPGVEAVAIGSDAPLGGNTSAGLLRVPEYDADERIRYYRHMVSPAFFDAIGLKVIRGRGFEETDVAGSTPVAIGPAADRSRRDRDLES